MSNDELLLLLSFFVAFCRYGDIVAVTDLERIVCIVLVIIGATVYAYFMGNINVIVAALNASGTRKGEWLNIAEEFHLHRNFRTGITPRKLRWES